MMPEAPYCPFCNCAARRVLGEKTYPYSENLAKAHFWYCDNGHDPAFVGCYENGTPKGTLADTETRKWRKQAHIFFDVTWQSGRVSRTYAYEILASVLNMTSSECHISNFNVEQCKAVIKALPRIHKKARDYQDIKDVVIRNAQQIDW